MGNPRIRLANALYDPWKADLIGGPKISEIITPPGHNEKKDSIQGATGALCFGQYRHLLVLSIQFARFTRERRGILI